MTAFILGSLLLIALALFALGVAAALLPARRRAVMAASAACCGCVALLAFAFLLAGGPPAAFEPPIGPPGVRVAFGLDALSATFMLLVGVAGAACAVYAAAPGSEGCRRAQPFLPPFVAAMTLTLLAADGFSLLFGLGLASLASWAMVLARHEEARGHEAAQLHLGMAVLGAACLLPALALLSPAGALDLRFAAIRAQPPEGWRATAVLALAVLGAGSQAGLAPLHPWLPIAHPAAPSHAAALMSGVTTKTAAYVLIRLLFDLCGPAQPAWWGMPLLAVGTASALLGAMRANTESDLKAALAASTIGSVGLVAVGLGIALTARALDLPALASLALGAALLHALNHGIFKTLLVLCAGAMQDGAGSRVFARLGGLIHRMPVTTGCALVGCAGLAGLPPGPGFAGVWLLFQSLLGGMRLGGIATQIIFVAVAALVAMAVALSAAAAVRLLGVAFLGRPRTPRAAAADDAPQPARWAMGGLAIIALLLGLLPGPMLRLLQPALRMLGGGGMAERAGWLAVSQAGETAGYAAPEAAFLLVLASVATTWAWRRWSVSPHRRGPAWNCGFAAPPAWLPFGDPATQCGAASFAQPLVRTVGRSLLRVRQVAVPPSAAEGGIARRFEEITDPAEIALFTPVRRLREHVSAVVDRMRFPTIHRSLSVMLAALAILLAIVALLEAI